MMKRFEQRFLSLLDTIEQDNQEGFIDMFAEVKLGLVITLICFKRK